MLHKNCLIYFTIFLFSACVEHDLPKPFNCSQQDIEIIVTRRGGVSHCGAHDGFLEITTGQVEAMYKIDSGIYSSENIFEGLAAGQHTVYAKSLEGCIDSLAVTIEDLLSTLNISISDINADSECMDDNGSATITIEGGVSPFVIKLNGHNVTGSGTFNNLPAGTNTVTVRDNQSCQTEITFVIPRLPTSVSWENDIKPIIARSCAKSGCHGAGSPRVTFLTYEDVKKNAAVIKGRTQNRSMPYDGPLPDAEIKMIACWVDDGALLN